MGDILEFKAKKQSGKSKLSEQLGKNSERWSDPDNYGAWKFMGF